MTGSMTVGAATARRATPEEIARYVVTEAVWATSVHNTQPWRFVADGQPRRRPSRSGFGTGWVRDGALELFTESVRLHEPLLPCVAADDGNPPRLDELRLHQGTVWHWNRAIYDPVGGGHLRIEMRALPSGPTVTDMVANAAFLIGLTFWLAERDPRWTYALPFERADHGFYRAAQYGSEPCSPPRGGDDPGTRRSPSCSRRT